LSWLGNVRGRPDVGRDGWRGKLRLLNDALFRLGLGVQVDATAWLGRHHFPPCTPSSSQLLTVPIVEVPAYAATLTLYCG
jgi:hypothetical protein